MAWSSASGCLIPKVNLMLESAIRDTVVVIDDHTAVRNSLRAFLETENLQVEGYATAESFLADGLSCPGDCLIVDINMPGMSGLDLQEELTRRNVRLPLIVMTGQADVKLAVRAMKAGAVDFLEKPFDDEALLVTIRRAIAEGRVTHDKVKETRVAARMLASLTDREREVLKRLMLGESNKLVAHHLGISPRTVEIHRANLQKKLKARSLADLVRMAHLSGQPV
jgi:two-component system response regulator FixJ